MVKYIPGSVYQVGRLLIDGLICVHVGAARLSWNFRLRKLVLPLKHWTLKDVMFSFP